MCLEIGTMVKERSSWCILFLHRTRCRFLHVNYAVWCLDRLHGPTSRLQQQHTPQPNSTVTDNMLWDLLSFSTLPLQQCDTRRSFEWKFCSKTISLFNELQEFNVYFTDTEQSFCFISLLWIAASQCRGTSFSERLEMFRTFQKNRILFSFFFSNKNIWVCSTPPLMSSTCKHLIYLEGRWTILHMAFFLFFKQLKTRQIKKSASNTKNRINFQSVIKGIVCVQETSLLPPLFAGSMSAPLRWEVPCVELLPFGFKGQSRPLQGLRAGAPASRKVAFPLNKYGRVYPAEFSPWTHPAGCVSRQQTGLCCLSCPFPFQQWAPLAPVDSGHYLGP